jgi:hypothetical protein
VWSYDGMICTGETYKDKVKLNRIFNSSLGAKTRRAIDALSVAHLLGSCRTTAAAWGPRADHEVVACSASCAK